MGASAVTPAAPPRRGPLGGVSARLLRVASDEKLVAAVRQGSQPAFEVVYDRHSRGILSFCRHMLGSREEAEDAVQHTFMAAYKALLGSDKDIQLKAWLYTIARNRCLSVLRARREQPSDEIEIASFDGLAEEVQRKGELQDMLRDLAELPEDQRAALVLSEIGDLGHDEIGDVLDVPKDKVKALVFQARSSLQQSREARDTSCEEIREMLSTLSGGSLRRTTLRRHVKECAGCQAFESEVKRQRRAMAAVLPVIPTIGLKESALAAAFGQTAVGGAVVAGGAAAGGAAAGGSLLGGGASALVAKVLVVTAVAGGGAAGVSAVSDGGGADKPRSTPAAETATPSRGGAPMTPAATAEAEEQTDKASGDKPAKNKKARRRGHDDRGKTFAEGRGKGKKRGLRGTQPGKGKGEDKAGQKAEKKSAKAREKAEKRKALEKSAKQRAVRKAREKASRQRAAKQPAKPPPPPPREKPKNENSQKPEPTPEPTPDPTPEPVPTLDPGDADGRGKSLLPRG